MIATSSIRTLTCSSCCWIRVLPICTNGRAPRCPATPRASDFLFLSARAHPRPVRSRHASRRAAPRVLQPSGPTCQRAKPLLPRGRARLPKPRGSRAMPRLTPFQTMPWSVEREAATSLVRLPPHAYLGLACLVFMGPSPWAVSILGQLGPAMWPPANRAPELEGRLASMQWPVVLGCSAWPPCQPGHPPSWATWKG
jgi:hypothetical protein